jgi:enamine deaminase RidA (YjgF/YER057c/UK114 family)
MIKRIESNKRLSRAVVCDRMVHLCGLTAVDKSGDVSAQTVDVLRQIDELLAAAGTNKSLLVSANVWLPDIADFNAMNTAWEAWIDPTNPPARATVQAVLAGTGNKVEIMALARLP